MTKTEVTTQQGRRFRLVIYGLTVNTGITDAVGFLGLGGAFTSVMTGNLVMTGLAVGTRDFHLLSLTASSIGSYLVGVILGSLIVGHPDPALPHGWHRRITLAITIELLILAVYGVGWELASARPEFAVQLLLLCNNAVALGIQAAAIQALGVRGLSTTFLTGTLTRVTLHVAEFKTVKGVGINVGTLVCLVAGAFIGGLGIEFFRHGLPALQVALLAVILLTSRPLSTR